MPPLPDADLQHVLERTPAVWERLRGARLFITGGTGFFGTWLLESLTRAADRQGIDLSAVVLTRSPESFFRRSPHLAGHRAIRLHPGDIRDFTFPDAEFSHVIHAAFPSGGPPADAGETTSLVVQGTERALAFAERARAAHFLFVSSGAVYGRQPADRAALSEDDCPDDSRGTADPRAAYGTGKRAAERLCLLQGERTGMTVQIARCFAFVGPQLPLDAHFAIGNFIRDALRGGPIRIRGDGTTVRSYLYAADLAIWLWTMIVSGKPGQICNVGSPEAITTGELARLVARELSPAATIEQDRLPEPAAAVDRYVPDVTRAATCLGLVPRIPLAEAIRRTASWARQAASFSEVA